MANEYLANMLQFNRDLNNWYNRTFGTTARLDPRKRYPLLFDAEQASKIQDTTHAQTQQFVHPGLYGQYQTALGNNMRNQFLSQAQPNYIPREQLSIEQFLPVNQNVSQSPQYSSGYINPYDLAQQQAAQNAQAAQQQFSEWLKQRDQNAQAPFYSKPVEQLDTYDLQMAWRYAGGIPEELRRSHPEQARAIESWLAANKEKLYDAYVRQQYPGYKAAFSTEKSSPQEKGVAQSSEQTSTRAIRNEAPESSAGQSATAKYSPQATQQLTARQIGQYTTPALSGYRRQPTAVEAWRQQATKTGNARVSGGDYVYYFPEVWSNGEELQLAKRATSPQDSAYWNWRASNIEVVPPIAVVRDVQAVLQMPESQRQQAFVNDPTLVEKIQ
ncbi:MAG: hypothetical protein KatS3mg087_1114 [Patescibacteria group bacterium]|nr:MAG: hypothetical protein KatS3mg087_1114 [Patescibacteria group bacterium]